MTHIEIGDRVRIAVRNKPYIGTVEQLAGAAVTIRFDAPYPPTGEYGTFSRAYVERAR